MMPFPRNSRPLPPHYYPPAARPFPRPSAMPRSAGRGLFGRLKQGGGRGLTGFERKGAGSAAQKAADPINLQQILSNTQQVLKTMQQAGPIIEQYGPLVRNLPSMWKLYKGLKTLPEEKKEHIPSDHPSEQPRHEKKKTHDQKDEKKEEEHPPSLKTKSGSAPKTSQPKLYI
ncbi:VrrA/YqfQ family protein [Bacillus sp. B190/17]|uniref:VrrA/YqfQ family protein n=1 Tax=Bacillus lumedeiriae TaxID=3058829 RepID=A0ABW8I4H6_9BACI